MSYLVDTNVLLRLAQKNHPMRRDARRALVALRNQGEALCILSQNVIEFYAVATRPLADNGLGLTVDEALWEIRKLKRIFKFRSDSPMIFVEWEHLVHQYQVIGKQAHDTRLVAAMKAHGLTHILTFNVKDFVRFADITPISP